MCSWLAAALALGAAPTAIPTGGCTCAAAREYMGWCTVHGVGYIGGVEIKSAWLFDQLDAHGHDVDVATFTCPGCRRAIASDGFCDEHKTGFVQRRAYFSWLTYALAHGTRKNPAEIACAVCRKNAASRGWCDRDRIGMIGAVAISDRADFDRTVHAIAIVELANDVAKRCEYCAAAIVTDTECPLCRITYKDGKPVRPPLTAPPESR